ncbi:MAG: hypothetical protein JOZ90_03865 [Alphaproteobacteria bacterium]|nr:hypothetical protein [Alphaproteobacteria bacterium]MBV9372777.1 hypothetical protein [Alphaproteobacteria bacterium]MBV9900216.1 hypothetical protein [Alphaproteobacteria bacterium]
MGDIHNSDVEISNTAINMISTMHHGDRARVEDTIARVIADVNGSNVQRLRNYPDVFVARGGGLRVIFKKGGGKSYVTTVAKEG